jgi:hypothetical protein
MMTLTRRIATMSINEECHYYKLHHADSLLFKDLMTSGNPAQILAALYYSQCANDTLKMNWIILIDWTEMTRKMYSKYSQKKRHGEITAVRMAVAVKKTEWTVQMKFLPPLTRSQHGKT